MKRLFLNLPEIPTIKIFVATFISSIAFLVIQVPRQDGEKEIGYKGFEKLLKETIDLAKRENLAKPKEFDKIYVDTTVQEKILYFQRMEGFVSRVFVC